MWSRCLSVSWMSSVRRWVKAWMETSTPYPTLWTRALKTHLQKAMGVVLAKSKSHNTHTPTCSLCLNHGLCSLHSSTTQICYVDTVTTTQRKASWDNLCQCCQTASLSRLVFPFKKPILPLWFWTQLCSVPPTTLSTLNTAALATFYTITLNNICPVAFLFWVEHIYSLLFLIHSNTFGSFTMNIIDLLAILYVTSSVVARRSSVHNTVIINSY